jgi:DNA repair protein RadC
VNLIVCHNHPSGILQASDADKQITRKLKEAGKMLDVNVLDHLIVTNNGYLSFADEGIL